MERQPLSSFAFSDYFRKISLQSLQSRADLLDCVKHWLDGQRYHTEVFASDWPVHILSVERSEA